MGQYAFFCKTKLYKNSEAEIGQKIRTNFENFEAGKGKSTTRSDLFTLLLLKSRWKIKLGEFKIAQKYLSKQIKKSWQPQAVAKSVVKLSN